MEASLEEAGFAKVTINDLTLYLNKNTGHYHRIAFLRGTFQSFVIESAMNSEEAKKSLFEDSDLYPLSIGENKILADFSEDLKKHFMK